MGAKNVRVRAYWQHKKSGEVFAVEVEGESGKVLRAAGPLHYRETTMDNIAGFNFDGELEDVAWMEENSDDFRVTCGIVCAEDEKERGEA